MRLFDSVLAANKAALEGRAATVDMRQFPNELPVAALTCIDPRLEPLIPEVLGVNEDLFVWLRNAGNIITSPTSSTVRSMALAVFVKGAKSICIIGHTDCKIAKLSVTDLLSKMQAAGISRSNIPVGNINEYFGVFSSEQQNVIKACQILRQSPLIPPKMPIHGILVDIHTGRLTWLVNGYDMLACPEASQLDAAAPLAAFAAMPQLQMPTLQMPPPPALTGMQLSSLPTAPPLTPVSLTQMPTASSMPSVATQPPANQPAITPLWEQTAPLVAQTYEAARAKVSADHSILGKVMEKVQPHVLPKIESVLEQAQADFAEKMKALDAKMAEQIPTVQSGYAHAQEILHEKVEQKLGQIGAKLGKSPTGAHPHVTAAPAQPYRVTDKRSGASPAPQPPRAVPPKGSFGPPKGGFKWPAKKK